MAEKILYSVNDALSALSISRAKFYAEAKAGKIRLRKIGVKTVVSAEDIRAYVASLPTEILPGPRAA